MNNLLIFFKNKHNFLYFLFIFSILIRIPNIFANNLTSDFADYSNIANNIKEGNGYTSDIRWNYFVDNKEITHPAYERMPFFPLFLSVIYFVDSSLTFVLLLNVLLFGLLSVVYFNFTEKLFNYQIAVFSSLFFVLNPAIFLNSVFPLTETFFLLFLILSFDNLLFNKSKPSDFKSGIFASLAYLTKANGLFLIVAILIWLLKNKKHDRLLSFFLGSMSLSLIWFVRNTIQFGNPLFSSYNYQKSYKNFWDFYNDYPGPTDNNFTFLETILMSLTKFIDYIPMYSHPNIFFLIFPFVLLGIIKHSTEHNFQPILLFTGITTIFFSTAYYTTTSSRFFLPVITFLIPIGVSIMKDLTNIDFRLKISRLGELSFNFFIILVALNLVIFLGSDLLITSNNLKNDRTNVYGAIDLDFSDSKISSTNAEFTNYYLSQPVLRLPDLNNSDFSIFLEKYDIKYIIIQLDNSDNYNSEMSLLLFNKENIPGLNLVYSTDHIWIYETL